MNDHRYALHRLLADYGLEKFEVAYDYPNKSITIFTDLILDKNIQNWIKEDIAKYAFYEKVEFKDYNLPRGKATKEQLLMDEEIEKMIRNARHQPDEWAAADEEEERRKGWPI